VKSIRVFLIVTLLSIITLVNFLAALHGYRKGMREAERLFDSHLIHYAQIVTALIAQGGRVDIRFSPNVVFNKNLLEESESALVFQIWDEDGHLLSRPENAPDKKLANLKPGYNEINFNGYRWRSVILDNDPSGFRIMVAQRMDVRYRLAEKIILVSVLPVILGLPFVAALIWLIVKFGLGPVDALAKQITHKEMHDLRPIVMDVVPAELTLLVETINQLFRRLETSFNKEKRFASDAAHELRTPIAALKIHVENMLIESEDSSNDLIILKQNADRMGHVVEQILNLNRTSPDHYKAKWNRIDLCELVLKIMSTASIQNVIRDKKQDLCCDATLSEIFGDEATLELLLLNVVENAIKYTPEFGEIAIKVVANKNHVRFSVSDSGPGIPEEKYAQVFERFYRLGGDHHNSGVLGCGLGLSIVKQIAELHHAEVRLSASQYASGLAVTFLFPKAEFPIGP